jgi:arylsulfatase A-like enzyme
VIVSDHGFGYRGYEHDNGPPGVLIVRGPGIRPGAFTGAGIADVTPTLLGLLGLPVADDMQGRPLQIAEPGGPLDQPVSRIATYGPSASRGTHGAIDPEALRRHEEYLRSLGYVN